MFMCFHVNLHTPSADTSTSHMPVCMHVVLCCVDTILIVSIGHQCAPSKAISLLLCVFEINVKLINSLGLSQLAEYIIV